MTRVVSQYVCKYASKGRLALRIQYLKNKTFYGYFIGYALILVLNNFHPIVWNISNLFLCNLISKWKKKNKLIFTITPLSFLFLFNYLWHPLPPPPLRSPPRLPWTQIIKLWCMPSTPCPNFVIRDATKIINHHSKSDNWWFFHNYCKTIFHMQNVFFVNDKVGAH